LVQKTVERPGRKRTLFNMLLGNGRMKNKLNLPTVIEEIGKDIKALLEGIDAGEERVIALYGAFGSLVRIFLQKGFGKIQEYFSNVKFIAVDMKNPQTKVSAIKIKEEMEKIDLPWRKGIAYFEAREFNQAALTSKNNIITIKGEEIKVDGVITAVPTSSHLEIAKLWAPKGVPVWVEKPITLPDELREISQLAARSKKIFAVDFMMDNDAFLYLLEHPLILQSIGKISRIEGRFVQEWPLEPDRYWLLKPEVSGGGLGMDMLVHLIALVDTLLQKLGQNQAAVVDKVVLGRYETGKAQQRTEEAETYMWLKAHLGDMELLMDAGKGVDDLYYGITIKGENGSIEIFIDPEEYSPPYLKVDTSDSSVIYRFKGWGLSYSGTFLDFLLFLYGSEKRRGVDLTQRLSATINAVCLVSEAYKKHKEPLVSYKLGEAPIVPERIPAKRYTLAAEICFETAEKLAKEGRKLATFLLRIILGYLKR
jgi:predicted dehydrogenase